MAEGNDASQNKGSPEVKDKGVDPDKGTPDAPQGEPSVSKADFEALVKENLDLQKKFDDSEKEKVTIQKKSIMTQLKLVNPKLAEANKDAEVSTLEIVLATANSLKSDFQKHHSKDDGDGKEEKDVKKGTAGYRLLDSNEWIE